jgi:Tfp pilus assembly protein PilN
MARTKDVWLYVERTEARLCASDGALLASHVHANQSAPSLELPPSAKGARLHAVIAETHCRWFSVTPPVGLTSFADLRALAAVRFSAMYDSPASGWRIDAEWRCDAPFLACAVPEELCSMVSEAARAAGCKLVSCRPAFAETWNTNRTEADKGSWSILIDADGLSLLPADSCAEAVLRRLPLPESGVTANTLDALLSRESILLRRPRPNTLRLFGTIPANLHGSQAGATRLMMASRPGKQRQLFWRRHAAMAIDFVPENWQRLLKPGRGSLVLAAAGVLVSCLAIVPLFQPSSPDLEPEIAQLQARLSRSNQPAPTSFNLPAPAAKAINRAIAELNIPWLDLFEAVEQATPETVSLLALEPDPARRTLKIEAEAAKPDDMLAYLVGLGQVRPFDDVALIRHETNERDPNQPVRFAVAAHYGGRP